MSQKTKEINVNDLLEQLDNNSRPAKDTNQAKQKKVDDWGHEEEQYVFAISKTDQASGKPKASKKKVQVKGWGDFEAEQNETKPAAPEKEEFTEVTEQPKKRMFKKPTGETKPNVDVKVDEEYFPSLGEEPPKHIQRKEPDQKPQPTQTTTGTGPRRFVNTKKEGAGETFAPIEVKEKEPVQPQIQRAHQPVIQRATEKPQEKPEEPNAEGKFKFGGEGPKRFVGAKTHKKEEEKSEVELLREQKEREVEEKLRKEREELAKELEARKARKAAMEKKHEEGKERPHNHEKHENHTHHDKPHQEPEKKEHHENGEPKRISKFTNVKKAHHEDHHEQPKQTTEEATTATAEELAKAKETEIVVTTASTKEWNDGGILKKPKKKV